MQQGKPLHSWMHKQAAELRRCERELAKAKEEVESAIRERDNVDRYIDNRKVQIGKLQHQVDVQSAKVESLRKSGEDAAQQTQGGAAEPPGWGQVAPAFKEGQRGKEIMEQFQRICKDIAEAEKVEAPQAQEAAGGRSSAAAGPGESSPEEEPEDWREEDIEAGNIATVLKRAMASMEAGGVTYNSDEGCLWITDRLREAGLVAKRRRRG